MGHIVHPCEIFAGKVRVHPRYFRVSAFGLTAGPTSAIRGPNFVRCGFPHLLGDGGHFGFRAGRINTTADVFFFRPGGVRASPARVYSFRLVQTQVSRKHYETS